MTQFIISLYASNEDDANAISKLLQELEWQFRSVAPSYDYDLDWDTVNVEEDEDKPEDRDPLYGAISNSIEGINDRA